MKFYQILLSALMTITLATATANAVPVSLSDGAPQTIAGQNFTFTFSSVDLSDGTNGSFRIDANGDYSGGQSNEHISWSIDGLVNGQAGPTFGATVDQTLQSCCQNIWHQTFIISAVDLQSITSDGLVSITLDLESGVNVIRSDNRVDVELIYNSAPVPSPEPGTWGLMTTGLVGMLGYAWRRKKHIV